MVAQTLQRQDQDRDILVAQEIDAEVTYGARQLISYHRGGAPVDIKSWGTADTVYEDVTNQLIAYGMQQGMARDMTRRLVQYAVDHADEFRAEHNANIIAVRLTVDEINPAAQFETGPVATFRLNGLSRQAEMASASGQNVRLTASGTATTSSDRSSVENVWQGVKEWSVWGKMEAPDKSELAGQTPALIAAALAQMANGELTPAEAATLQAQLEALAQEGLIAPELADIVRAVETMRAMVEGGMDIDASMAQPQALADYIAGLIEQGLENGNLPPELARQVMESIASFSEAHGLEQVFTAEMMQSLNAAVEWTAVTQALGEIMPHLSAESRAAIEAMLESGEVPAGEVLAEQLAAINEIIAQADLPEGVAEHVAALEQSSAVLQDIAQSQIDPASAELSAAQTSIDLASLSAVEIQQIIASMEGVDPAELSPEQAEILQAIQEAMGTADLANVTPEQIEAVLNGRGDAAMGMDVITPAAMVAGATVSAARFAPMAGSSSVSGGGGSTASAYTASNTNSQSISRPAPTSTPETTTATVTEKKAEAAAPVVKDKKNDPAPAEDKVKKPEQKEAKQPEAQPPKKPDAQPNPIEGKKPDILIVPPDKKDDPAVDNNNPKEPAPSNDGVKPPEADNKDDSKPAPEQKGPCKEGCKCGPDFDKAAAGNNGAGYKRDHVTGASLTVDKDGSVTIGRGEKTQTYTKEEARQIIEEDRVAAKELEAQDRNVVSESQFMDQYIGSGGAPSRGSDLNDAFVHVCGDGCHHNGPVGQAASVADIKARVGEALKGSDMSNISLDDMLKATKGKYDNWGKPSL